MDYKEAHSKLKSAIQGTGEYFIDLDILDAIKMAIQALEDCIEFGMTGE